MKLIYDNKLPETIYLGKNVPPIEDLLKNKSLLIRGDNADVMRALLQHHGFAKSVDLVYIDPPFSTNTTFRIGEERTSTISSHLKDRVAYKDILQGEYFLEFIRERLILLRELMSSDGSIYFHIDYKIGHYIKVIMDEVFGSCNFRNDIARIKCNPKNFTRKGYGNIKDMVLFYSKNNHFIWNEPRTDLKSEDIQRLYKKIDKEGRKYTTVPVHAPGETSNGLTSQPWRGILPPKGRHWRCAPEELEQLDKLGLIEWSKAGNPRKINFAEEASQRGKKLQDIWEFKDKPYPDYPTQKNPEMLHMIVKASSNKDSTVMDCFCGSGTTLIAAENLGRKWIGIDKSHAAIEVTKKQINSLGMFAKGNYEYVTYEI